MKTLKLLIITAVLTGCQKEDLSPGQPAELSPHQVNIPEGDWKIDVSIPEESVNIHGLKSTEVFKLMEWDSNMTTEYQVGEVIHFDTLPLFNIMVYYYWHGNTGDTIQAGGNVNGASFFMNSDTTINICHGHQNVLMTLKLYK